MKQSAMVQELHYLGIDESDARLLLLAPLLMVAWADKKVIARESALIRAAAKHLGLAQGGAASQVSTWLEKRPSEDYLNRAIHALKELLSHEAGLGADVTILDLKFVLESSRAVALAGSGTFGFLRYAPEGRKALEYITATLNLEDIDFELDAAWDHTEEFTGEIDDDFPQDPTTEMTDGFAPGFMPGEEGFAIGLEGFLTPGARSGAPTPELLAMIRQTDLRYELNDEQLDVIARLLWLGDALPLHCAEQLIPTLELAIRALNLPAPVSAALRDPVAVNAIRKAGWDMAHSLRYGGAFSGSVVLRNLVVLRTTAYRQPATDFPAVLAHEGGYLEMVKRFQSVSAISEHYGVDAPESCQYFVHLFFCLNESGFHWLPVVIPLGNTPGKIVLSPELLTAAEQGLE